MKLPTIRQALATLLVIFIIYAVIKTPTQAAAITANIWAFIKTVATSLGVFFDALLNSGN